MKLLPVILLLFAGWITGHAADYNDLQVRRWNSAKIQPYRKHEVKVIADRVLKNRARYAAVAGKTAVPWFVICAIHNMESGGSFACHLHEGSPLTGRTRFVPKGRPKDGSPPFSWEVSAVDAMEFDKMGDKNWKRLGPSLTAVEFYNGSGVARYHPDVASCYLYGGMTGDYGVGKPGRYVSDGRWSSTAVSSQIGVAAVWKELEQRGAIIIPNP